jgi:hypothetical protein
MECLFDKCHGYSLSVKECNTSWRASEQAYPRQAPKSLHRKMFGSNILAADCAGMTREHGVRNCVGGKTAGEEPPSLRHARSTWGSVQQHILAPPRLQAMLTLRPSISTQMTKETGKRPNGAAPAIHAIYGRNGIHVHHYEGIS